MYPVLSTFGPASSRVPRQHYSLRKDADGPRPLRPGIRARRLRRRDGGRSARAGRSRHRRPRPHRARAPGPPRRLGRRGRDGRRRRHIGADPSPLPGRRGRGGRVHAARRRRLRRGAGLPAHRPRRRPQGPHGAGAVGRGGGAGRARLAGPAHRAGGAGQDGTGRHAEDRAGLRGPGGWRHRHHGPRAPRLRAAQAGGARGGRPVLPVALGEDAGLQGHAHLRAAAPVLPRPA